jgi:hypothetical protein
MPPPSLRPGYEPGVATDTPGKTLNKRVCVRASLARSMQRARIRDSPNLRENSRLMRTATERALFYIHVLRGMREQNEERWKGRRNSCNSGMVDFLFDGI